MLWTNFFTVYKNVSRPLAGNICSRHLESVATSAFIHAHVCDLLATSRSQQRDAHDQVSMLKHPSRPYRCGDVLNLEDVQVNRTKV